MRAPDELRDAVEAYLGALPFAPELGRLEEALRYALESGGKRIRPVLCLAVAEAAGGSVEETLSAAAAVELVLTYEDPRLARELVAATLGMIGGQHRDITGDDTDLAELHRLKTGRLFSASVGLGLGVARVPEEEQLPWRTFGDELGLLFQVVDDILDGDGFAARFGVDAARQLADEAAERARERLRAISADTSVLQELVDGLVV